MNKGDNPMQIKKGVILAAGYGTRLLPITKSIPKPMLPILNRPAIDYIVEEALSSGIEEIAIVCNHKEEVLHSYFHGQKNIHFIHQPQLQGAANALWHAFSFVNGENFALFFGDELTYSNEKTCISQLIDIWKEHPHSIVTGVESDTKENLSQYNVLSIDRTEISKKLFIKEIIEKPSVEKVFPSSYTSIGRFIMPYSIFDILKNAPKEPKEEVPLTPLFNAYAKQGALIGYYFDGKRFDIGTPEKWLKTNVELAKISNFYI